MREAIQAPPPQPDRPSRRGAPPAPPEGEARPAAGQQTAFGQARAPSLDGSQLEKALAGAEGPMESVAPDERLVPPEAPMPGFDPLRRPEGAALLAMVGALVSEYLLDSSWIAATATFVFSVGIFAADELFTQRHQFEPLRAQRMRAELLSDRARLKTPHGVEWAAAAALRPGQEVIVHAGEIIPVDGIVASGTGEAIAYPGSRNILAVVPGQHVLAGVPLASGGPLLVLAQRAGRDRAFAGLLSVGDGSVADEYLGARFGRALSRWGALSASLLLGLLAYSIGVPLPRALLIGSASWLAFATPILTVLPRLLTLTTLHEAEKSGVVFPSAETLRRAGQVSTAVFCARGTVQSGEPSIAEVHPLRGTAPERLLALAAGALSHLSHPVASAVLTAARVKGVEPEPCRSHQTDGGATSSCRDSDGREITVGSREFLLKQKISVAWAEETLREIESQAMAALLVAEEGHIIGVLAVTDDLAPGARTTVQSLVTEGIEPALLSGDSRETTEALAARLGIDHVRAQAQRAERRSEIEQLRSAGITVAVIGRLGSDDASLSAADVPIILGHPLAVSSSLSARDQKRSVFVWSGQVVGAAVALRLSRALRRDTTVLAFARLGPAVLGAIGSSMVVLPPFVLPLMAGLGHLAVRWYLRRRSG